MKLGSVVFLDKEDFNVYDEDDQLGGLKLNEEALKECYRAKFVLYENKVLKNAFGDVGEVVKKKKEKLQ